MVTAHPFRGPEGFLCPPYRRQKPETIRKTSGPGLGVGPALGEGCRIESGDLTATGFLIDLVMDA